MEELRLFVVLCLTNTHLFAAFKYSNEPGKPVIVMSAPSVWDSYYKEKFHDLVSFQMDLAKILMRTDNVVLLADRNTLPYLQGTQVQSGEVLRRPIASGRDSGRSHDMPGKKLPDDVLLEANVYDVFLKDFSPMGLREVVKFRFEPKDMDPFAARQIDKSMMRFLTANDFRWAKNATVVLSGSQLVDNGERAADQPRWLESERWRACPC